MLKISLPRYFLIVMLIRGDESEKLMLKILSSPEVDVADTSWARIVVR